MFVYILTREGEAARSPVTIEREPIYWLLFVCLLTFNSFQKVWFDCVHTARNQTSLRTQRGNTLTRVFALCGLPTKKKKEGKALKEKAKRGKKKTLAHVSEGRNRRR